MRSPPHSSKLILLLSVIDNFHPLLKKNRSKSSIANDEKENDPTGKGSWKISYRNPEKPREYKPFGYTVVANTHGRWPDFMNYVLSGFFSLFLLSSASCLFIFVTVRKSAVTFLILGVT